MPPLLPKQRILLPDKALCYCPPLGIERAISSPVTRRCWTNFLFLCTCWIPGSPSTGERREENIVRNYVPRITGSTRERLNGSCFSQPYPNGELAIQMTSREEPGFVIVFCSMGCNPLASPEINSAWLTLAPWLPWTEILQSKLRFPTPSWDHDAGRHLVRHPNFYRRISEIVFQRGVCGSLAVKFILRLTSTF